MGSNESTITIPALQQMKRDGRKIVGVVAWDYQIAQIADRAGIPVFAEFHGGQAATDMTAKLVDQAKRLEQAGASLLDFRYSGPVAGPAVVRAARQIKGAAPAKPAP